MKGHVLCRRFGLGINAWEKLIDLVDKRKTEGVYGVSNGYDAQIVLREHYIDTYEICNLDDPSRPWPLISDHPRDGLQELWGWERRQSEFELYEITKYYGYNFTQFVSLPRHRVESILQSRRKSEERLRAAKEKAARQMEQQAESGKLPVDPTLAFRGHRK